MVKRQKEKQYNSAREQRAYGQSRSATTTDPSSSSTLGTVQRRLPWNCCALTLTPFTTPVCTSNGILFEHTALVEFVWKYKKDPVTGNPMTSKDVIALHMDQSDEGQWQCPILTKPFMDHTKIVAIWDRENQQAYVYSYEAYHELNVKPKHYTDLTTGKSFHPKQDVLILNDPQDEAFHQRRDINTFWHVQHHRSLQHAPSSSSTTGTTTTTTNKSTHNIRHSVTATRVMEQLEKNKQQQQQQESSALKRSTDATTTTHTNEDDTDNDNPLKRLKVFSNDVTGVAYTSGKASGSLTSTIMDVTSDNTSREASAEELRHAQFQEMKARKGLKGMVRLVTSMGTLMLELHCDIAPRTCTNFLGLCQAKKYNQTTFHRLIRNFMIQGGKNPVVGAEDASLWGPAFPDEFDDRLKHIGGGIVSMANAGPGTNKQQFFITLKSCPHLDRKHSIFGRVVEGMDVLKNMERMPVDKKDRPLEPIKILETEILVDPAKQAKEIVYQRIQERVLERQQQEAHKQATALGRSLVSGNGRIVTNTSEPPSNAESAQNAKDVAVGKYLPKAVQQQQKRMEKEETDISSLPLPTRTKKPPSSVKFGNFSGW